MQEGHRGTGKQKPMFPSRSRSEMWRHTHEEDGSKSHTLALMNVSRTSQLTEVPTLQGSSLCPGLGLNCRLSARVV